MKKREAIDFLHEPEIVPTDQILTLRLLKYWMHSHSSGRSGGLSHQRLTKGFTLKEITLDMFNHNQERFII